MFVGKVGETAAHTSKDGEWGNRQQGRKKVKMNLPVCVLVLWGKESVGRGNVQACTPQKGREGGAC